MIDLKPLDDCRKLLSGPKAAEMATMSISADVAQELLEREATLCEARLSMWHHSIAALAQEKLRCENHAKQVGVHDQQSC